MLTYKVCYYLVCQNYENCSMMIWYGIVPISYNYRIFYKIKETYT
jgi:hypothetical protein